MPPPLITNENPVNPLIPPGPPIRVQSTGVRPAVDALSDTGASAVLALHTSGGTAVFAASDAAGVGIEAHGGRLAGLFKGNMEVTGNITLTGPTSDITLTNEDCAE